MRVQCHKQALRFGVGLELLQGKALLKCLPNINEGLRAVAKIFIGICNRVQVLGLIRSKRQRCSYVGQSFFFFVFAGVERA